MKVSFTFKKHNVRDEMCSEKLKDVFEKRRSTELVLPTTDLKVLRIAQNIPGCFIAGGAALALYNGEFNFLKDWDLFFSSRGTYKRAYDVFRDMGFYHKMDSRFGSTLELKGYGGSRSTKINLIDWFFPNNIKEIFDSFDFAICCFAVLGDTLYYTKGAQDDEEKKILNVVTLKEENIVLTFKRIARYGFKGYTPSNEFVLKFEELFNKGKKNSDIAIYVKKGGCGS